MNIHTLRAKRVKAKVFEVQGNTSGLYLELLGIRTEVFGDDLAELDRAIDGLKKAEIALNRLVETASTGKLVKKRIQSLAGKREGLRAFPLLG